MNTLHPLLKFTLWAFSVMCLAIAAACIEWIRLPPVEECPPQPKIIGL
jgi:hypothetical protein